MPTTTQTGHLDVNGLHCYYEIHGQGAPLLLLHGRQHISQNRLAILPDVTHYDMFLSPQLVPTVRPFLDGKTAAASWAEQVAKGGAR